jgi:hypothetical protein
MNTERLVRNGKVLLKAERIIADIRLRQAMRVSWLNLAAGAFALFGAVMLGIAAFLALSAAVGPILAATIVGFAAVLIGGVLAMAAGRVEPGRELEVAQNLEAAAFEALMADVREVEAEVAGFTRVIRNPLDGALPGLVVPLAGMVLKTLRRRGEEKKAAAE